MPPTPGILHTYHPSRNLNLFEHTPYTPDTSPSNVPPPKHILLFIGGLYDNFLTPSYTSDLAALFPLHCAQTWRLIHTQLSSAGRAFGTLDVDRDIGEIGVAIDFIRQKLYRNANEGSEVDIVLMGHSTGCQDTMRYLSAPNPVSERQAKRPVVQGAILQAPVSDRDAMNHSIKEGPEVSKAYDRAMAIVNATSEKDYRDVLLPLSVSRSLFGPAPLSIARFLSLASPGSPESPSIEDFFSGDLTDERLRNTFGRVGRNGLLQQSMTSVHESQSILILMSDSDEHASVDQRTLLLRWKSIVTEDTGAIIHGESSVILNALHDVGGDDWPSQDARLVVLRKKVLHYLKDVVGDIGSDAMDTWHKDGDRVMALKSGDGRRIEDQVGVLKL